MKRLAKAALFGGAMLIIHIGTWAVVETEDIACPVPAALSEAAAVLSRILTPFEGLIESLMHHSVRVILHGPSEVIHAIDFVVFLALIVCFWMALGLIFAGLRSKLVRKA